MADPLFDTLFRSTVLPASPPAIASAAPVREAGTRSRAGNAMNRTRAALLVGARRAVEVSGTKITMAQVAAAAGVAKATLYNHFRTREAVLDALLLDEVRVLTERAAGLPLADALATTAAAISDSPLLRTLWRASNRPRSPPSAGSTAPPSAGSGPVTRSTPRWPPTRAAAATSCCAGWPRSCSPRPDRPPSPPTWPCSSPRCPTPRPRPRSPRQPERWQRGHHQVLRVYGGVPCSA